MIVQFKEETEENQTVNFYDDLTDEQKAVFDAFEELSNYLIV